MPTAEGSPRDGTRPAEIAQLPLSRLAGPLALAAGASVIIAQLVMWPTIDPDDHQATSQNVVYQVGGVGYFLAFCLLLLALVASYVRQAAEAGRLGVIGVGTAMVGTMFLGGDLWFETYVVPWLADAAPTSLEADPAGLLVIGALSSYVLFAVGWLLFGIASLRAHVYPKIICLAIMVGGVIGYHALVPPWGVPLGLAVAWLGLWLSRTPTRSAPS